MLNRLSNITIDEKGVKNMKKNAKKKKGFTLVELIAVIAILGILAAVIVPKVGNFTGSAKTSKIKANASTVLNAIETYNAQVTDSAKVIGGSNLPDPTISSLKISGTNDQYLDSTAKATLQAVLGKLDITSGNGDDTILNSSYSHLDNLAKTATP